MAERSILYKGYRLTKIKLGTQEKPISWKGCPSTVESITLNNQGIGTFSSRKHAKAWVDRRTQ